MSDRMSWGAGEVMGSQCATCVHKAGGAAACKAYPSGIPEPILDNAVDHRHPYADDGGVRYEPEAGFSPPADWTRPFG